MSTPEPVSFTVHNVATPDLTQSHVAAQRRTRLGRWKMLAVLAVCASPVVASYLTYFVIRPEGRTNYGTLIQPSRGMPALPLVGLDGKAVAPTSLRGQWLLVVVGPSSCQADCEKRLHMQRQLRQMLGREQLRLDKIWLVTDDAAPAPALIAAVTAAPAVQVLRAPRDAVAAWLQPAVGQALEDHLYVVDPMGEWMLRLPANGEPARAKRDLDRVLRASSFWDKAGR